jgi:hypothetical protein
VEKYSIRHDKIATRSSYLRDGKFAFGIIVGLLTPILIFIANEFFRGAEDSSQYLIISPIIISLLVAMASTYFSANALLEQRRTREASTDPVLVVHLGQREDARELVTFNISNVGAGAALKVQLNVDKPHDEADEDLKRNYLHNIFAPREPFAVLLQGQSIEFNFALGWHLLGQDTSGTVDPNRPLKPLSPFLARISYEDLTGAEYNGEFVIDVRAMRGLGSHKSPQMRIASALETIAKRK